MGKNGHRPNEACPRLIVSGVSLELCPGTRKHARFKWTPECQAVSEFLKESLTVIPLLAYPNTNLPYELYTDASANCIGAVLSQEQEDIDEDGTDEMVENLFPVTYTESYSMSVFGY